MTRIAIIGGGLSGLTTAYELEKARLAGASLDWHLYEASHRPGGIIETTRLATPDGEYILEGGPDGWVTEKPWARELAIELGLGDDLITSNDATRKTYIYLYGQLQAIPNGMRLMVPEDLAALEASPLFSASARQAYAEELSRAAQLKADSPFHNLQHDESVATFVLRHFGREVLEKLAAPLLSGVFGGDVHKLSVRAVMPQFVAMEQQYGSLVFALQHAKHERGTRPQKPIFTTLRQGMGSLIEALLARLPPEKLQTNAAVHDIADEDRWIVAVDQLDHTQPPQGGALISERYDQVVLATSLDASRKLLNLDGLGGRLEHLLPSQASSAVLVSFTWPPDISETFQLPAGFGFLVPQQALAGKPSRTPQLLAGTFVHQKFPCRAPAGACILRAFFGTAAAEQLADQTDTDVAQAALTQLRSLLGPLPSPSHTSVRRWPRSLPQYEVGHLERMAELEQLVAALPGLTLLGSSYRGVGIPDLVRDARAAAQRLITRAESTF